MTGLKSPSLADGYEALQHRALARYEGLNVPTRNAHLRSIQYICRFLGDKSYLQTGLTCRQRKFCLSATWRADFYLQIYRRQNGRREMRFQTLGFSRPWEQFWLVAQCDFR